MHGMNATTGKPLEGDAHLSQSIGDILSTPIGTRIGLRDYGSDLPDLIDQPANRAGALRLYAAAALAIARWEPRIALIRVGIAATATPGAFAMLVEGRRTDTPGSTRLTIPVRA